MKRIILSVIFLLLTTSSTVWAVSTDTCFDTDTVLMLHMNGTNGSTTFTDSSASAHSMTAHGNVQIDTSQSKFGGASGKADGTGDFITAADSADWDFGTGDFTVDVWLRFNAFVNSFFIDIGASAGGSSKGVGIFITDTKVFKLFINGANVNSNPTLTLSTGTWYHFAVTRSGSTVNIYKDGSTIESSFSNSDNITGSTEGVSIFDGNTGASGLDLNGWGDELRIIKGTSVTPPSEGPSAEYIQCATRRRVISTVISE